MERNKNYFPNIYRTSASDNSDSHTNFHNDNMPGPSSNFVNNPNSTITHEQATEPIDQLRSVNEILPRYRSVFAGYPCFNIIQSKVFDEVLYSDESIVVSAPTGSGKTVIFELAIVRFLTCLENLGQQIPYKIVYVAPMKALCEERLIDWHSKFATLGLTCLSVTGDSENIDFQSIMSHNLIVTTPEKWDSLTRRWRDNQTLVALVKLFMIDEVHLLSEDHRGPTLEAVVCRMKTLQEVLVTTDSQTMKMRFVAVSACIPNAEDVAEWLSTPIVPGRSFKFGDEMRPVKLKKVVLGYPYNPQTSTPFKFDIMLSYRLQSVMIQYAEGKPTLIFCSTRKSVEMTSKYLIQNLTINLNPEQKQILQVTASTISDIKIRELLVNGVCFHHAGLAPEDRKIIEELFRKANLPILVTTSTLAMGVNLPAHLVIVKSTKYYSNGIYQDYSESMLLQMIGRAGRPQFDTSATAVILTTNFDKQKFENLVGGEQTIESNLHSHLTEHLNAEVVLHTITDLGVAMQWLTSTFLHIRARKHPRHYGLPLELTHDQIDKKLLDMCQIELNRLARVGMLTIDQNDVRISPTSTGTLMAKYCIAFDTMKLFTEVTGKEILQQILGLISKCREFSEIYLRVNDKKALNLLNKCRNRETIRFPYNSKIKTLDMKINCIIQAVFGCLQILDQSLVTESQKIMRIGERISKCLAEYLETKENCYSALLNALILAKCFHARLWEDSPFVSKQLSGIGSAFSSALVTANKTTFKGLLEANPRDIERIINRRAPMGNTIHDQVAHLPDYELTLEEIIGEDKLTVNLKVSLKNFLILQSNSSVNVNSFMFLLVGDTDNNMYLYEKLTHKQLIQNPEINKKLEFPITYEHEIKVHFISEDWVGFDCNASLLPSSVNKNKENIVLSKKSTKSKTSVEKGSKAGPSKEPSHIQTFMHTFFKDSKVKNQKQVSTLPANLKPRKSDSNKKNNSNQTNVLDASSSVEIFQNFDKNTECVPSNSSFNILRKPLLEREASDVSLSKQNTEETNSGILPKNENLQKLIDDCIQEYKKQNENKLRKLQESSSQFENSKGYFIPEPITKNPKDAENTSLVRSNNYSATARRSLEQENKLVGSNSKLFMFSDVPPIGNQKRRGKKMKPNIEESFCDLETKKSNSLDNSTILQFKYTPRKFNHGIVSSHINQESELNTTSTDNEDCVGQTNEIKLKKLKSETPEYEVKDLWGINLQNTSEAATNTESLKSCDNFQKTLTWRSPLVISPAVRYSPILENDRKFFRRPNEEDNSFSSLNSNENARMRRGNNSELKFIISVNNDSSVTSTSTSDTNIQRPTLKNGSSTLPLSDESYSQSLNQGQSCTAPILERNNEDPFLSNAVLEDLGLIQNETDGTQFSTPPKENRVSGIPNKKVGKNGEGISESEYYSKVLLNGEKFPKRKVFDFNENKKKNRNVSSNNSSFLQPRSFNQVGETSKQNISVPDVGLDISFVFPIFSPEPKKRGLDKKPNSATMGHLKKNIFSQDENLFSSQIPREKNLNNSQLETSFVSSFSPVHLSSESRNRLPRVTSGSFPQIPTRKRLGRYGSSSQFGDVPTPKFGHYGSGNCQCGNSHPAQEEFQFQQEIQNQRPWHNHHQPMSSQMGSYKERDGNRLRSYHYPRDVPCPMIGKYNYFEQSQTGPHWDNMNTIPSLNSFGYNRHGNMNRQKVFRRTPSMSRSYSCHDECCTMKPNYYSQQENIPILPGCKNHSRFDDHGTNFRPYYNPADKQFMLQRYLNRVGNFAETSTKRSGFGRETFDFPMSIDAVEDEEDEEDEFLLN